eukprot:1307192-Karenia_brevis.AAC.1
MPRNGQVPLSLGNRLRTRNMNRIEVTYLGTELPLSPCVEGRCPVTTQFGTVSIAMVVGGRFQPVHIFCMSGGPSCHVSFLHASLVIGALVKLCLSPPFF